MKVVLREEVENLGEAGEIVTVRDGYARNFLVPRGLAFVATGGTLKRIEHEMKLRDRRVEKEKIVESDFANKLKNVSVTIPMRVGEEEKLYGSVTAQMISDGLANQGYKIDRRNIQMDEPIRTLGGHDVPVKLRHGVQGSVKVNVVAE